jgi:hypothetical protein
LDITQASLGSSQADSNGMSLVNISTSTSTNQVQISPPLRWRGTAWDPTSQTSGTVDFRTYVSPATGDPVTARRPSPRIR